jgi:hypothetical protein
MGKGELNPADAQRKADKKKELARNKMERKLTRDAKGQHDRPDEIKKQVSQQYAWM